MALHQGEECFCKWMHVENGQVMVRRIHHLKVQAHDGSLHDVRGKRLPDAIATFAGRDYKDLHMAQILLARNPGVLAKPPYEPPEARFWPAWRDVVHVAIGLIAAGLLNFVRSLASLAF